MRRVVLTLCRRLTGDRRGATMVEFAIVAPTFLMLLMGGFDLAHQLYVTSAMQGAVQKAARDSTLESGVDDDAQAGFDSRVTQSIYATAGKAEIKVLRRYYRTFEEASQADPEVWTDTNNNKTCDAGEPYQDENNNKTWDKDGGDSGQGAAKDRVVYTVSATFPRYFPFWSKLGLAKTYTVMARTVLQNQPYADQQSYGTTTVRNCP